MLCILCDVTRGAKVSINMNYLWSVFSFSSTMEQLFAIVLTKQTGKASLTVLAAA